MSCRRLVLLFLLFIALMGLLSTAHGADTTSAVHKAYNPFDELRPKIPQQMLDDKRLDVKVKVFCKSKNMKQLFADLSAKTGVKITAARELWGERPIIYFHNRPLRDVLTEVAGLYGYHWLISGKPGSYEYELFEDIRHAKRRGEWMSKLADDRRALVAEFTEKAIEDPGLANQLLTGDGDSSGYRRMEYNDAVPGVLAGIGMDALMPLMKGNEVELRFADLPAQAQAAIVAWRNKYSEGISQLRVEVGTEYRAPKVRTPQDFGTSVLRLHPVDGEATGIPRFYAFMDDGDRPGGAFRWPPSAWDEDDLRKALGEQERQTLLLDKPLPEKIEITADKPRWTEFGDTYVVAGDVLDAIAERTRLDVIADYYQQDYNALGPIRKTDLGKVLSMLWDHCSYVCRFDGSVLVFRYYDWYSISPPTEPSAVLIEKCWKDNEANGSLDMNTMVEIACLPDDQLYWRGFDFIPNADWAQMSMDALRLWRSLGSRDMAAAKSDAGLSVSSLTAVQMDALKAWIEESGEDVKADDVGRGTFKIRYVEDPRADAWKKYYDMELNIPNREPVTDVIRMDSMFSDKEMKLVLAQRKADAKADVVEVLQ